MSTLPQNPSAVLIGPNSKLFGSKLHATISPRGCFRMEVGMGIVRLGGSRFRVQIRRKGFPHFDKIFHSLAEAQAGEQAALARMEQPHGSAEDMTLSQAWERYHQSSDFADKSANTQRTEEGRIKPILARLGGYSLANLASHPRFIWNYVDERRRDVSERTGRKLSTTSIRLELAALSSVAAWAVKRQLVLKNFVKDIQRPGQAKRKRRVPPLEQGKLELAMIQFDLPMLAQAARFLLLLRYLGCRPGELAQLLRTDIRFARRDVTFRNTKHKGEHRLVHVTEKAVGILDAQYKYALEVAPDSPYLFSTEARRSNNQSHLFWKPYNYAWGVKVLQKEGLLGRDFHAHAMRREYISRAIETGLPYATIRKQTGHHSTQAIEIYDEGLSTAPEIRQALDDHEKALRGEALVGLFQAYGFSQEDINKAMATVEGRKKGPISKIFSNGEVVETRLF